MLVNFLNVHCPHLQSRFKIIERLVTANKRPSSIHTSCIITGSGGTSSRRTSTMGSTSKTPLKQMGAKAVYPNPDPIYVPFASRRSVVHSTGGMVACTQVLASEAGQRILKMGGNAAVSQHPGSISWSHTHTEIGCRRSSSSRTQRHGTNINRHWRRHVLSIFRCEDQEDPRIEWFRSKSQEQQSGTDTKGSRPQTWSAWKDPYAQRSVRHCPRSSSRMGRHGREVW